MTIFETLKRFLNCPELIDVFLHFQEAGKEKDIKRKPLHDSKPEDIRSKARGVSADVRDLTVLAADCSEQQ